MNWDILGRLADEDGLFNDIIIDLHIAIAQGWDNAARRQAIRAAGIAHELMDRADDLDAMERDEYYEMHPPEGY